MEDLFKKFQYLKLFNIILFVGASAFNQLATADEQDFDLTYQDAATFAAGSVAAGYGLAKIPEASVELMYTYNYINTYLKEYFYAKNLGQLTKFEYILPNEPPNELYLKEKPGYLKSIKRPLNPYVNTQASGSIYQNKWQAPEYEGTYRRQFPDERVNIQVRKAMSRSENRVVVDKITCIRLSSVYPKEFIERMSTKTIQLLPKLDYVIKFSEYVIAQYARTAAARGAIAGIAVPAAVTLGELIGSAASLTASLVALPIGLAAYAEHIQNQIDSESGNGTLEQYQNKIHEAELRRH